MICEDFANQDGLGNPNEYFVKAIEHAQKSGAPIDLEGVMQLGEDASGSQSVKVMANYLVTLDKLLGGHGYNSGPERAAFAATFEGAYFVFITRRQKDRQALSRITARKTGIYHLQERPSRLKLGKFAMARKTVDAAQKLSYSSELAGEIVREIDNIRREEETWMKFFASNRIEPFRIVYEKAAAGGKSYLKPLETRLNTALPEVIAERAVKKLSGSDADILIDQFREQYPEFKE